MGYTGNDHRTEYVWSGVSLLAAMWKFDNGTLTGTTNYVRAGYLPLQERDGSNAITREYTWGLNMGGGIGGLLNLRQNSSDYAYLYDGKGNVAALLSVTQAVVASYAYDPFGVVMKKTATIDRPYMFSTKEFDSQTGLSYYGYRFYNPSIGKWTTRDPLEEAGGMNLYGFVGNDPVNWIDPNGLHGIYIGGRNPFVFRYPGAGRPIPSQRYTPPRGQPRPTPPRECRPVQQPPRNPVKPSPWEEFMQNLADWLENFMGGSSGPTLPYDPSLDPWLQA